jgi:spermidine synthase
MERELERKQPQQFDLLAIDAFSGDAIPIHLLTEEAFQIYLKEIKPEGIIAVHITNTYFDLQPPLVRIAEYFGLKFAYLHTIGDNKITMYSDWVLLSRDEKFIDSLFTPGEATNNAGNGAVSLWTDDYSNLFQILRR